MVMVVASGEEPGYEAICGDGGGSLRGGAWV